MRFPDDDLSYWGFLSREEWQFCYALTFARQLLGLVPVTKLNLAFRDVIIEAHRDGYSWSNLEADDDDHLHSRNDDPVCPENLLFLRMIQLAIPPDYDVHVPGAIQFAEEAGEPLSFHVATLRGALDRMTEIDGKDRARHKQLSAAEKEELWGYLFQHAVESVGLTAKGGDDVD